MNNRSLVYILMCISWCVSFAEQPDQDQFDKSIYDWSRVLSETFHLMKNKYYVKDLDPKDAMLDAINSFVHRDPHSTFLDPRTYQQILQSTTGEFFGIGVIIASKMPDDEFLVFIDTLPGGPAEQKGVRGGDKLIDVDGTPLKGLTTEEASGKLKGARNTPVTIKVMREHYPEPLVFTLNRDIVKEQSSFCYLFKDHNVCYLQLNTFSQNAVHQLAQLLKKAQKQHYKGIILDLRNNGGGLLTSAIDIAELFIDKKSLVATTKDRNDKVIEQYATTKDPIANFSAPIFILMNNWTASSAEILAGSLKCHSEQIAQKTGNRKQDRLLVFLVGTKTFGKGSVQELIPISNDCAVKITTALYFLPDNKTIQGIGIEPDIKIDQKLPPTEQMQWVNTFYGKESSLKNTIKTKDHKEDAKAKKKEEKKSYKDRRKEALGSDSQIKDTITCINILNANSDKWKNRNDGIKLINSIFVTADQLKLEEIEV